MEAEHTPGPWSINAYGEIVSPTYIVGTVKTFDHPGVNGPANALLIAAAPDMADALEPFATAARGINPDFPDNTVVDLRIGTHTVYQVALGSLRAARVALGRPNP